MKVRKIIPYSSWFLAYIYEREGGEGGEGGEGQYPHPNVWFDMAEQINIVGGGGKGENIKPSKICMHFSNQD